MTKFTYPILTAEQQYDNLVSKWLIMDDNKDKIISFLTHHSYFKIMLYFRPYWTVDVDGNRKFNEWISWSRILVDYNFDHELRVLLFSYTIYIENSFKNTFCQYTCQKLWNTRWENKDNFNDPKALAEGKPPQVFVESILDILKDIIAWSSKHEHIQKYIDKQYEPKNPPFRNMIEVFTFGQIVKMYRYLADVQIQKDVAKQYNLDETKMRSWMKALVDTRNICCHHNKLFDKKNRKIARVKEIELILDNRYDTIYHVCCIMHNLLEKIRSENWFMHDLAVLLSKYPEIESTFPENRKKLWNV